MLSKFELEAKEAYDKFVESLGRDIDDKERLRLYSNAAAYVDLLLNHIQSQKNQIEYLEGKRRTKIMKGVHTPCNYWVLDIDRLSARVLNEIMLAVFKSHAEITDCHDFGIDKYKPSQVSGQLMLLIPEGYEHFFKSIAGCGLSEPPRIQVN